MYWGCWEPGFSLLEKIIYEYLLKFITICDQRFSEGQDEVNVSKLSCSTLDNIAVYKQTKQIIKILKFEPSRLHLFNSKGILQ